MIKDGREFFVGDRVSHRYRGDGVVSPCEYMNCDPSSIYIELDSEPSECIEVSVALVSRRD